MSAEPQPANQPEPPAQSEQPEHPHRRARELRGALFASDLKRLVRASAEDDDAQVSRIRQLYLAE